MELLCCAEYYPNELWEVAGIRRPVAAADEDALTLGVEAARRVLEQVSPAEIGAVVFATSSGPLCGLSFSSVIRAALDLHPGTPAVDVCGPTRSGSAALEVADGMARTVLVVMADLMRAEPMTVLDASLSDAATAMLVAPASDASIASFGRHATLGTGLMDGWWTAGADDLHFSDLRLAEHVMENACCKVLEDLDAAGGSPDSVVVSARPGLGERMAIRLRNRSSERVSAAVRQFGYAGVAQLGIDLAAAVARPDRSRSVVVLQCTDVCDGWLVRPTCTSLDPSPSTVVDCQAARTTTRTLDTKGYLERRSRITPEMPMRPPSPPISEAAVARQWRWKYGFVGSRCRVCGSRLLQPEPVCEACGGRVFDDERFADVAGRVVTVTQDGLSARVGGQEIVIVDLDGGGRVRMAVADGVRQACPGDRTRFVFRRSDEGSFPNYVWKVELVEDAYG